MFWQNSRTWQMDRQTPHDSIGLACIALCSKKWQALNTSLIQGFTTYHSYEKQLTVTNLFALKFRYICSRLTVERSRMLLPPTPPERSKWHSIFMTVLKLERLPYNIHMFSTCPFVSHKNLWTRYFENELSAFDANWHVVVVEIGTNSHRDWSCLKTSLARPGHVNFVICG